MVRKTLARVGQSPVGFLMFGAVTGLVALGVYLGGNRLASAAPPAREVAARPAPRALSSPRQQVLTPEQEFGPAPTAAGFAEVLVSTSNAFAHDHGYATRLTHAHCVQAIARPLHVRVPGRAAGTAERVSPHPGPLGRGARVVVHGRAQRARAPVRLRPGSGSLTRLIGPRYGLHEWVWSSASWARSK